METQTLLTWQTARDEDGKTIIYDDKGFIEVEGCIIGDHLFVHRSYEQPWTTWDVTHIASSFTLTFMSQEMDAIVMAAALLEKLPELAEIESAEDILENDKVRKKFKKTILGLHRQYGFLSERLK